MSWKLSEHDQSGSWHLSERELEQIQSAIVEGERSQRYPRLDLMLERMGGVQPLLQALTHTLEVTSERWIHTEHLDDHPTTNALSLAAAPEALSGASPRLEHMIQQRLGARLLDVLALIPPGHALLDIGTDHGHLPAAALLLDLCPVAAGIDIAPRPLELSLIHI